MTPDEIRAAIWSLGLTQDEAARLLDTAPSVIRAILTPPEAPTHREPPPRLVRLLQAYLAGYRPDDWPQERGPRRGPRPRQTNYGGNQ